MLRIAGLFWTIIIPTCPVFFLGPSPLWAVFAPFDSRRLHPQLYPSAWAVFSGRGLLPWRSGAMLVANLVPDSSAWAVFSSGGLPPWRGAAMLVADLFPNRIDAESATP